jgi:hypothetical protein
MKVGIFYNSFRNPAKFPNKVALMDNFAQGVLVNGDTVERFHDSNLPTQTLDCGFVLGYTLEDNFRRKIINSLQSMQVPIVYVDSNILHYARPDHEWHRYSINAVYPSNGIYFFDDLDQNKWQRFSEFHNLHVQPWRSHGDHVLILCQRPHGWNMFGNNQESWLLDIIANLRLYTDRPIMIRMHPGDGSRQEQIHRIQQHLGNKVAISNHANIRDALSNCWASVGYNSTPNVVSAIEGVPVCVSDPANSWAAEVAFKDLSQIENPPLLDRCDWLTRIANIHWSNQEVRAGLLWQAIKKYICAVH